MYFRCIWNRQCSDFLLCFVKHVFRFSSFASVTRTLCRAAAFVCALSIVFADFVSAVAKAELCRVVCGAAMSEEIIKLEDGYGKVYKDGIQPFLQFIEGQDDKDFFKAKEFVKHYECAALEKSIVLTIFCAAWCITCATSASPTTGRSSSTISTPTSSSTTSTPCALLHRSVLLTAVQGQTALG